MGTYTYDPETGNTTPNGLPDVDPGDGVGTNHHDDPGSSTQTPSSNPTGGPSSTETWVLDATSITSLDQSEHDVVHPGDELYLARVAFRATVGTAGTTTAYFNGGVSGDTTIRKVKEGETHSIPDAMGKVSFPRIVRRGLVDILNGDNPELIGTIDVLFEDDNTSKGAIVNLMGDLASATRDELAAIVEPLDLMNLDEDELAGQLQDAASRIEDSVVPSVSQQVLLFLASFFNPDDLIGFKVNLFLAVDSTLAPVVDAEIADAVSASTGTAGSLEERSYSHTYSGSSGKWRVSHQVSS